MKSLARLLLITMTLTVNLLAENKPLQIGDPAPILSAVTDSGATINLGDVYKAHAYTLVYFYPKAKTGGCTAQGCSLRDADRELAKLDVFILGVSTDTVKEQAEFKAEQQFPFTLLADTDRQVTNAFQLGAAGADGKGNSSRQAYLIHEGKIVYADHRGATKEQARQILDFLAMRKRETR
ncbi:MAG: redoxin domain-containing protein [Verrucomicrobiales bacterium]|jgi:peroxiredoxin Q/BCP|nr:redoxin domain-containing protein [Verrucomicrobiales bacterium]